MLSKTKACNKQWAIAMKNSIQSYRPFYSFCWPFQLVPGSCEGSFSSLSNLVPRFSLLPTPWRGGRGGEGEGERDLSLSLAPGGGKKRDPGNEVEELWASLRLFIIPQSSLSTAAILGHMQVTITQRWQGWGGRVVIWRLFFSGG